MTLRDVQGTDNDFLFELFSSTREDELSVVPWNNEQKDAFLRMQFDAQSRHYSSAFPDMDYKIILIDGNRAGRLLTVMLPGDLHVIDIAILPSYRNLRIGTMLLRDLMSQAEMGNIVLSLYVEIYNRARTLYKRLGFVEVKIENIYTRMEYRPGRTRSNSSNSNQQASVTI